MKTPVSAQSRATNGLAYRQKRMIQRVSSYANTVGRSRDFAHSLQQYGGQEFFSNVYLPVPGFVNSSVWHCFIIII